jgi:cyclic pyranopterin phosphate synthase
MLGLNRRDALSRRRPSSKRQEEAAREPENRGDALRAAVSTLEPPGMNADATSAPLGLAAIDLISGAFPRRAVLADQFRRPITYLRISVTDRCNLRCVYCMPEAGLQWLRKPEILTYEEIARIVEAGASAGLRSVRITGGEPLVRRDLPELVRMLSAIPGIDDISLSTNGVLLADYAARLAAAGLHRVNVSLDTLREDRFFAIARRRGLDRVLAGIDAALAAGFSPVKINCVVMRGRNDDEISGLAALTRSRAVYVRFIEMMPVEENVELQRAAYVPSEETLERIAADGELIPVDGPAGNGPARYFAFRGAPGAVGVISPLSHDYCERCNRVRLSADGRLRLCLFGDHAIDLRSPLRGGASREELADLFRGGMLIKPERHHLKLGETASRMRAFSEIGG